MSVGIQVAGYRLEEEVGHGGMGVVYRAHDLALERSVALKLLSPGLAAARDFRERFLVESRLAASLDHPNAIPVYDAGEADGQLYLAMRYVEGADLKRLLQEEGTLEPPRAIAICSQVANALDSAHARGLVHRDVKPSNVLLDEREHAYLADFGLTRRLSEQAPGFEAGLSLGTPAYVAPEQIEGKEVDGRADQYSLACLLHECLTGEPPFPRASEAATLFAHLEEQPPAPPGLEEVMARALAKDPQERYASCSAFVGDAREALQRGDAGRGGTHRRRRLIVTATAVVAAGAAISGVLLTAGSEGSPATISQAGLGGVKLGSLHGENPQAWGRPGAIILLVHPDQYAKQVFAERKVAVYYDSGITEAIQDGLVGAVEITSWNRKDRTRTGVGPCSTLDELKAAYGARLKPVEANTIDGKVFGYTVGRSLFFAVEARANPPFVGAVAVYSNPLQLAGFNAINDGPCT